MSRGKYRTLSHSTVQHAAFSTQKWPRGCAGAEFANDLKWTQPLPICVAGSMEKPLMLGPGRSLESPTKASAETIGTTHASAIRSGVEPCPVGYSKRPKTGQGWHHDVEGVLRIARCAGASASIGATFENSMADPGQVYITQLPVKRLLQ